LDHAEDGIARYHPDDLCGTVAAAAHDGHLVDVGGEQTLKKTKKVTPCVNGSAVAAGASCEVGVTFTPTQTGLRTGDLTFTDNAPNSPQSVGLSGTGK
jgi:hypothetical protein